MAGVGCAVEMSWLKYTEFADYLFTIIRAVLGLATWEAV